MQTIVQLLTPVITATATIIGVVISMNKSDRNRREDNYLADRRRLADQQAEDERRRKDIARQDQERRNQQVEASHTRQRRAVSDYLRECQKALADFRADNIELATQRPTSQEPDYIRGTNRLTTQSHIYGKLHQQVFTASETLELEIVHVEVKKDVDFVKRAIATSHLRLVAYLQNLSKHLDEVSSNPSQFAELEAPNPPDLGREFYDGMDRLKASAKRYLRSPFDTEAKSSPGCAK